MKCTLCSAANPDGSVYCDHCGAVLDSTSTIPRPTTSESPVPVQSEEDAPLAEEKDLSGVRLRVTRGSTKGKVFPVEEGSNLIGRWDPDTGAFPEIDLEADDVEAKISRKHALLERRGEQLLLKDIGSLNGTFVNRGPRMEEGVSVELNPGDEIIVGKTFLQVESGEGEADLEEEVE